MNKIRTILIFLIGVLLLYTCKKSTIENETPIVVKKIETPILSGQTGQDIIYYDSAYCKSRSRNVDINFWNGKNCGFKIAFHVSTNGLGGEHNCADLWYQAECDSNIYFHPFIVKKNMIIDSTLTWQNYDIINSNGCYPVQYDFTKYLGDDNFLAIKAIVNGQVKYGWIRFQFDQFLVLLEAGVQK